MKNSKNYYNTIADNYQNQVISKIKYLNAVDDYILNRMSGLEIENYLDVGTGDGRRAFKFIEGLKINGEITLVDESDNMLLNAAINHQVRVFNDSFFNFETEKRFDLITCLWNVLGHLPTKNLRIELFKWISKYLTPGGVFIFDVNNRYNISYYGYENVSNNLRRDHEGVESSGWFTLGTPPNETQVYIHSPFDIEDYIKATNLVLEETVYIDYETGEKKTTFFEGQLIYKLKKVK